MYPYWDTITKPLLGLLHPNTIVEIGSERGKSTQLLLAFCQEHDVVLHAIDPAPKFDAAAWQARHQGRFIFHAATSLEALPRIAHYEAVFIDGDHNWYTVFHELKAIETHCATHHVAFPLVFLHDIDWPYGRRDLYYDPATIPEAHRRPYARQGIRPGNPGLQEHGGHMPNLYHAATEGTPRNGVRTAIEDFLEQTTLALDFIAVPGFHGLGLLFPQTLRAARPALSQALDAWALPPPLHHYLKHLEAVRVNLAIHKIEHAASFKKAQTIAQARQARLQERIQALTHNLQTLRAQLARLQRTKTAQDQQAESSDIDS